MPDRIILVDDASLLLDSVRFSLERAGYEVHTADTQAAAGGRANPLVVNRQVRR